MDAQAGKGREHYKRIGFMCGLEIHQRLSTREKLFCSCPTTILGKGATPSSHISRYQRAVAGELGAMDVSAQFEELRNREFTYNIYDTNACLVEIDEEPPHEPNREALEAALSFASALKMRIVNELQPMRKAVVDGSDPSAFQRSMLIALGGSIEVEGIRVNIPSMFLEEESSGIVESTERGITYNTDRLGVPLVEIDTDPYIPDPATAKRVALHIGTMLRISGKVQRGIGSIRQDVNVSIKGGNRVEIKGVQDLDLIDSFLENEILRQQNLIEIKKRLELARAQVMEPADLTHVFKSTKVEIIQRNSGVVLGFGLKGFKGLLGFEINPKKRLGTEISDYAKMAGVKGIIHSDEDLQKYGFSDAELVEIRKSLDISDEDSFILVAGEKEKAEAAVKLAHSRARSAFDGVLKETRVANDTVLCTTKFMRPLPTGSRMYPETDVKPIPVTREMLEEAMADAPDTTREMANLEAKLHNKQLASQLLLSPKLQLFKDIVSSTSADPSFVANTLIQKFTELRRQGLSVDEISDERLKDAFQAYADGEITKQAIDEILKELSRADSDVKKLVARLSLERITGKALKKIIDSEKGKSKEEIRRSIMSSYRLRVDGAELNSLLQ
ncbi:MAG: Glu-tRNA(Gln) amidotransferase subunit GatE [Candidatus Micrarchaeota archaeon]|nr:Glu-tRNA(Gln) amidotransferase subunit GatE [Candidatus Micrarchaeota archaeon]